MIVTGDCLDVLAGLEPDSIDAIVTDPPYGLGFMGKEWDTASAMHLPPSAQKQDSPLARFRTGKGPKAVAFDGKAFQEWMQAWADECLRVLKPGGHLVAFGGSRTYHRLAVAIEDAGFEIRDQIQYLYGSGFPKSLDVSKAIDKAAGAEREVVGRHVQSQQDRKPGSAGITQSLHWQHDITAPATTEAQKWNGWGTALKPAHEPIVLARKPLTGTVAATVQEYGTGALNIDGCRVEGGPRPHIENAGGQTKTGIYSNGKDGSRSLGETTTGRWPANLILDPEAGAMMGPESRFFYTAKASSAERNAGLSHMPDKPGGIKNDSGRGYSERDPYAEILVKNHHPTVKPIDLMRWLVRLVTPPGGTVLDPFTGSGTTGIAAHLEGFEFVGIEREAEYAAIAEARIEWWQRIEPGTDTERALGFGKARDEVRDSGQAGLF